MRCGRRRGFVGVSFSPGANSKQNARSYVTDVDGEFARHALRAMGNIATRLTAATDHIFAMVRPPPLGFAWGATMGGVFNGPLFFFFFCPSCFCSSTSIRHM